MQVRLTSLFPGASRGRTPSSSSSKRARKKTLSPSKDPFLMTPEALKEAVFKLCVFKLKKDKVVRKNVNPDNWIGKLTAIFHFLCKILPPQ